MLPFTRTQLTGVINKRRPVVTPIRDAHFNDPQNVGSSLTQLDILDDAEGLAVAISAGARSTRAARKGWSSIPVEIPRFSEHDIVLAADTKNLRAPGTAGAPLPLMQLVNRKMDTIRKRFDRTIEYMCITALKGKIVDGGGNVIATYDMPAAESKVFKASGTGGDNPFDVFDDAELAISRALGGDAGTVIAYAGKDAYSAMRHEQHVIKNSEASNSLIVFTDGKMSTVAGTKVRRLAQTFTDNDGNETPFLDDNELLITSDALAGQMVYGPCETPEGMQLVNYFVDTWASRDPAGDYLRVETNPLPIVGRPQAVRRYTISTS